MEPSFGTATARNNGRQSGVRSDPTTASTSGAALAGITSGSRFTPGQCACSSPTSPRPPLSAATASADVKALIQQSGEEVASGTRLVAKAEDRLTAILAAVRENSGLMAAISEAAHGQAAAIGEVNTAVRSMDEMTQHNAALVEQNNAAIQRAEAQAGDLDEIVAAFRLDAEEPSEEALDEKIAAVEASARGLGPAIRRAVGDGMRRFAG